MVLRDKNWPCARKLKEDNVVHCSETYVALDVLVSCLEEASEKQQKQTEMIAE